MLSIKYVVDFIYFFSKIKPTVRRIGVDPRCEVHKTVLRIREEREGWFSMYCPGAVACDDDGEAFGDIVSSVDSNLLNIVLMSSCL